MNEKEFNAYMLQTVEKVRERLHVVENSLSSTSSAMLSFNKNMAELIDLQKQQTSELEKIKSSIGKSRAVIEFFEKKSTWYIIVIVLLILSKKELFDVYQFVRGFLNG